MKSCIILFVLIQVVCCKRTSKVNKLPESLRLVLKYSQSDSFNFNLLKIDDDVDKVKVVVGDKKGSHFKPQDPNKHFSMYRDDKYGAAFTVIDNDKKGYSYYGSFTYKGSTYILEPVHPNDVKHKNALDKDHIITIGQFKYHLKKNVQVPGGVDDTYVFKKESNYINDKRTRHDQRFIGNKQILTIEVFAVLDYSLYQIWMKLMNNDENMAITNMRHYFTEIMNGVIMRYEQMEFPGFIITVDLVGFYIAAKKEMAPFVKNVGNTIDAHVVLSGFSKWVMSPVKKLFPRFDVAALFTGHDMKNNYNGLAYVGGVCYTNGVSVNKVNGPFDTAHTTAHEIGHNVGAPHDGENNNCTFQNQFIMAPQRLANTKGSSYDNQLIFSNCSKKYFVNQISFLNSKKQNCMEDYSVSSEPVHADKYLNGSFGQTFSLDYQCKITFGPQSYLCSPGSKVNKPICEVIGCYKKEHRMCVALRPAVGTSCGLRSWCIKGRCVKDDKAPTFRDECILGDSTHKVQGNTGTKNCKELIIENPTYCNQKEYKDLCCESCGKFENSGNKNCIYGDQHSNCNVKYCKSPYYRIVCCKTCDVQHNDQLPASKCDEEATTSWCNKVTGNSCYQSFDRCCLGCAEIYDPSVKGCEYGDKSSWCADRIKQSPDDCKSTSISGPCCQSCRNYNSKKHATTVKLTSAKKKEKPTSGEKKKFKLAPGTCIDLEDCRYSTQYTCYELESRCCASCIRYLIPENSHDCRYGDKLEWCVEYIKGKHECELEGKECCQSCKRYLN